MTLQNIKKKVASGPGAEAMFGDSHGRLEHLASDLASFEARVLPRRLITVAGLLAWLTGTGVLWPLSVLPGLDGWSSKGAILASLALGIAGLLAYVGYELNTLRELARFRWDQGESS